jgi:16S rRNA (guanine1207-N2)-methyltransferase
VLRDTGFADRATTCKDKGVDSALETLMLAVAEMRSCGDEILVLGARPHAGWREWKQVTGWQWFKPLADAWDRAGFLRVDDPPQGRWPVVALLPGKSKEEILHGFALARDRVTKGGVVVAALPNTAGAGRFEKEFSKAVGAVESLSKHKCRVFWAVNDGSWNEGMFDEWRVLGEPRLVPGTEMLTVPGVFSAERIDEGSRFLLENIPRNLRGMVADLGAGWGYLTGHVLHNCPQVERVDLYEADARALQCARRNLGGEAHKTAFHWHDVTQGVPGGYDAVVMNPPFHTGQDQDIALGQAFLGAAAHALRPGGRLFLVANRQLPYEHHLDSLGLHWRNTGENHAFKLISGEKKR